MMMTTTNISQGYFLIFPIIIIFRSKLILKNKLYIYNQ